MPESAGTTPRLIGPYRIERELARGGMGIVYLARDTRLNRTAALKALPEDVAADPERLQRFEREAKLLASVSHPNIATIYGIETSEGRRFLALEYIEGESLAARLARGPLSIDETLEIGAQIAAGIEAAHEAGIIHRDLKPANVVIAAGERVKVVDFGLAKAREDDSGSQDVSPAITPSSPTMTRPPTEHSPTIPGVILGTAPYLSPEQARGKPVDRRSDIWSFGCVLYECLTGSNAFRGETVSDTISLILTRDPDWSRLPPRMPSALLALIRRCLVKDARRRLRDIGEARLTLEDIRTGVSTGAEPSVAPAAPPARSWYRRLRLQNLVAGALGFVVAGAFWNLVLNKPARHSENDVLRVSIEVPPDLRIAENWLTPDGRTLVVLGIPRNPPGGTSEAARLYVRRLSSNTYEPLRGTEGVIGFIVSPDSKWIVYLSNTSDRSFEPQIFKVPMDGSAPPVLLMRAEDTWGRPILLFSGDQIVPLANGMEYVRLPANGGPPSKPVSFGAQGVGFLYDVLPHDRGVLLDMRSADASSVRQDAGVLDLKTGKAKRLIVDAGYPFYSPSGHIVFTRGGTLLAVRFDVGSLETKGQPVALMDGLSVPAGTIHSPIIMTRSGTLLYLLGGDTSGRQAISVAPDGHVAEWSSEHEPFEERVCASPDGMRIASQFRTSGRYEIWISDRGSARPRRLMAVPGASCEAPTWSPDGKRIAYFQQGDNERDGVYVVDADGNGEARRVAKAPGDMRRLPSSWSPDGKALLITRSAAFYRGVLEAVDVDAGDAREPRPLFGGRVGLSSADLSPDGRAIAYVSDEGGHDQVYVSAWDPSEHKPTGPSVQVSRHDGYWPRWGRDGTKVYFATLDEKLAASTVTRSPQLAVSDPAVVWDMGALGMAPGFPLYDILPDGHLLTIRRGEQERRITRLDIALNFDHELRAKVGR